MSIWAGLTTSPPIPWEGTMSVLPIVNGAEPSSVSASDSVTPVYEGESAMEGFPAQGTLVTHVPDVGKQRRGWLWVCSGGPVSTDEKGVCRVSAVLFDQASEGAEYTVLRGVSAGQLIPVPAGSVGLMAPAPAHFGVLGALAERNVVLEHEHEGWVENIVSEAQEWADSHDMCSAFEEFMHDHDLEGRERDFEFYVRVQMSVPVTVTSRMSEQDARDSIDSDAVLEAIREAGLDSYDWEVD